jgi:hypothetical protein
MPDHEPCCTGKFLSAHSCFFQLFHFCELVLTMWLDRYLTRAETLKKQIKAQNDSSNFPNETFDPSQSNRPASLNNLTNSNDSKPNHPKSSRSRASSIHSSSNTSATTTTNVTATTTKNIPTPTSTPYIHNNTSIEGCPHSTVNNTPHPICGLNHDTISERTIKPHESVGPNQRKIHDNVNNPNIPSLPYAGPDAFPGHDNYPSTTPRLPAAHSINEFNGGCVLRLVDVENTPALTQKLVEHMRFGCSVVGVKPLSVGDRTKYLRTYRNCFQADELVTWVVNYCHSQRLVGVGGAISAARPVIRADAMHTLQHLVQTRELVFLCDTRLLHDSLHSEARVNAVDSPDVLYRFWDDSTCHVVLNHLREDKRAAHTTQSFQPALEPMLDPLALSAMLLWRMARACVRVTDFDHTNSNSSPSAVGSAVAVVAFEPPPTSPPVETGLAAPGSRSRARPSVTPQLSCRRSTRLPAHAAVLCAHRVPAVRSARAFLQVCVSCRRVRTPFLCVSVCRRFKR